MNFVFDCNIKDKVACVYKIEFDNKIYIGSTINLRGRAATHTSNIRNGKFENISLFEILNCQIIRFSVLEYINDISILRDKEKYWIKINRSENLLNKAYAKDVGYVKVSKNRTSIEWAMVRVDCNILEAVKKHLEESGSHISIGKFFEIAAEEKLKSENK